ncbi:hypothetical protein RHGRI_001410 [Rhododendron griersonianum]|uniref:SKA complex subunit 1 homolog n=1 Tax=Rhododendron griersonianum TaxID=479676 RepID=A0AAV6LKI7_9ERIC|nr:hypothetical protein RHGRI_001410 [Rhododendron griersonianum]
MDVKQAGPSLDSLISSFNTRIAELQELVIARNMYPASSVPDLSAVDATLKAMELQVQHIKDRLREETQAIPKAKGFGIISSWFSYSVKEGLFLVPQSQNGIGGSSNSTEIGEEPDSSVRYLENLTFKYLKLIEASLRQQKKLQSISVHVPYHLPERLAVINREPSRCLLPDTSKPDFGLRSLNLEDEPALLPKEKKGRASAPLWFIASDELDSLSSYMRGRLTLDKVNAVINEMSTYAEANAQLITAPRKKLSDNMFDKALELREIGSTEAVKGKHFFLETDIKGPSLKLDNTGKAILTVLRHLGRIRETRIGHHRVYILLKPQ